MKIFREKKTETVVEQREETIEVAECPWCSQTFDPDEAEEIHRNPNANPLPVVNGFMRDVLVRASQTGRLPEHQRKAYEQITGESLPEMPASVNIDTKVQTTSVRTEPTDIDLQYYICRLDVVVEELKEHIREIGIYSDSSIKICPKCADSIMGVE